MTHKEATQRHARAEALLTLAEEDRTRLEAALGQYRANLVTIEEAQAFIQQVAKDTQEQIRYHLEDIVNMALDTVFPMCYTFHIVFEIKRNKTEARLCLFDGEREIDPMFSNGGGVKDILTFALRVALLLISKNRRVLILDEPFKSISADLKDAAFQIMRRLSTELGIQIIAITHDEGMIGIADKVIRVSKKEGVAHVE